jgi:hypothetical protein
MAISTINIGNLANDGTGDDLREAFIKVNNNFLLLDARQPENTSAANRLPDDATTAGVFAEKIGDNLLFKSLKAGQNISLSSNNNQVTINSSGIVSILFQTDGNPLTTIGSAGSVSFIGSGSVATSGSGTTLTIDGRLSRETAPALGANLSVNGYNITGADIITANNYNGLVKGIDLDDANSLIGFDFGGIQNPVQNLIQWLEQFNPVNMGTITAPSAQGINLGSI